MANEGSIKRVCAPKAPELESYCAALNVVLAHEGGVNGDPADRGNRLGAVTNFGITQSTYDSWREHKELPTRSTKEIELAEVETIYYEEYWLRSGSDKLSAPLSLIHFDSAVNHGVSRSKRMLNSVLSTADSIASQAYAYLESRKQLYRNIAVDPSQLRFLKGWLNRVNSLEKKIDSFQSTRAGQ